jgi:phage tail sheath protein FI
MKKLLTALALLTALGVAAQRNNFKEGRESLINFGVKGGVNANKISGQSYKNGFNYNFQAGVFVQINFSKKIGLQPEVNFVQTSSSFSEDASDVYDDLFRDGSQKRAKLNYLEVPLLVNINIGPTKKVKLQFGPAYGGLLKQTIDSLKTNANLYKTSDWSAIGGFWIQLPVNFGARYKLGLSDINAIDDRQTWKNQSLQVFVGVTL